MGKKVKIIPWLVVNPPTTPKIIIRELLFKRFLKESKYTDNEGAGCFSTGKFFNKIQMLNPATMPGTSALWKIYRHPKTNNNPPAVTGPNASPILPPIPCSEMTNPRREEKRRDKAEIAEGCHSVIAIFDKTPARIMIP